MLASPRVIVLLTVPDVGIEPAPRQVLLEPVVILIPEMAPAYAPIRVLLVPEVRYVPAIYPTPVLLVPDTLFPSGPLTAWVPQAVFPLAATK
jgi:hypothetical protein